MNHLYKILTFTLISIFIISFQSSALDATKIDARLKMMLLHPQLIKLNKPNQHGSSTSFDSPVKIIMKTNASPTFLKSKGVVIGNVFNNIVTGSVGVNRLAELARSPEIEYIQAPLVYQPLLDESIKEINVQPVYQNYGATGKGVIIGIIDTGIDWRHEDFKNANGSTRIKYLLDLSIAGSHYSGGTVYTEQNINNALMGIGSVRSNDIVGHGTHVAGIAAGNGRAGSSSKYKGVAPEADLVIVKATRIDGNRNFESEDYIIGLKFLDSVATVLGKPYVANLSFGSNGGPHDGTLAEESDIIDYMFGSGISGKVMVCAAGNEGENEIHSSGTFFGAQTSIESKFKIYSYTPNSGQLDDFIEFEIWYDGSANHAIALIAPDGTKFGPVNKGQDYSNSTSYGAINILNSSQGSNGDNQALIQVFDYESTKPPKSGDWKIVMTGTSGRFDIWMAASMSPRPNFITNIDRTMLINSPGNAKNAITVGAYTTKNNWTDIDGNSLQPDPKPELYNISGFSSPGPTRDWRTKPEIAAPGEMIAASYSSNAPPTSDYSVFNTQSTDYPNGYILSDGVHALSQGTSMAVPHVSGLIALLLQKYPSLDAQQIKEALIATARSDEYTLTVPNNHWGYGKLDAHAAMNHVAGQPTQEKFTVSIQQNPALTQYIDFYLIAKYTLQSTPTATMQVGTATPTPINMVQVENNVYKGEYQFSVDGTAILKINTRIQGESTTTLTEYFGVKLLKPLAGGSITYGNFSLNIPANSFAQETYFTVFPIEVKATVTDLQEIGAACRLGPADISFNHPASLTINYAYNLVDDFDEEKLALYSLVNNNWEKLNSQVDQDRNTVTAAIHEAGIFRICYDADANTSHGLPQSYLLYQNYPNPFNAQTSITYEIPVAQHLVIRVYNIRGEYITTLVDGFQQAGSHKVIWNTDEQKVPSGLYIYRFAGANYTASRKMLLLK